MNKLKKMIVRAGGRFKRYWQNSWWHKLWMIVVLIILLIVGTAFGIAQWYIHSEPPQQTVGVSFIPDYAEYLGVNPKETLSSLEKIGVRHFRLVSYWSDIEPTKGKYDFSQLDWQFRSIEKSGGKISLAIGLRQPRWPECHAPDWVDTSKPASSWQPQLEIFMSKVIDRYKNSSALASYQLENEFFNTFGECHNYDRNRLISEYKLVKRLDNSHPVIISRSNNSPNFPTGQPRPDKIGISIYRKVWSPPINRYFTYPMPPKYYSFLAGSAKILTGRDSIIHEMQAEPWPPDGKSILETSLTEQNKTFNAQIFKNRIKFAEKTHLPTVYYWGAEYWYYRKVNLHDPSVWHVAQQLFK